MARTMTPGAERTRVPKGPRTWRLPREASLAFQIRDDMLDVLGDAKKLGKATNADGNKNTFVSLYGIDRCRELIAIENKKAIDALAVFEDTAFLYELTELLASREV